VRRLASAEKLACHLGYYLGQYEKQYNERRSIYSSDSYKFLSVSVLKCSTFHSSDVSLFSPYIFLWPGNAVLCVISLQLCLFISADEIHSFVRWLFTFSVFWRNSILLREMLHQFCTLEIMMIGWYTNSTILFIGLSHCRLLHLLMPEGLSGRASPPLGCSVHFWAGKYIFWKAGILWYFVPTFVWKAWLWLFTTWLSCLLMCQIYELFSACQALSSDKSPGDW